jgi:hypothetical protein
MNDYDLEGLVRGVNVVGMHKYCCHVKQWRWQADIGHGCLSVKFGRYNTWLPLMKYVELNAYSPTCQQPLKMDRKPIYCRVFPLVM